MPIYQEENVTMNTRIRRGLQSLQSLIIGFRTIAFEWYEPVNDTPFGPSLATLKAKRWCKDTVRSGRGTLAPLPFIWTVIRRFSWAGHYDRLTVSSTCRTLQAHCVYICSKLKRQCMCLYSYVRHKNPLISPFSLFFRSPYYGIITTENRSAQIRRAVWDIILV